MLSFTNIINRHQVCTESFVTKLIRCVIYKIAKWKVYHKKKTKLICDKALNWYIEEKLPYFLKFQFEVGEIYFAPPLPSLKQFRYRCKTPLLSRKIYFYPIFCSESSYWQFKKKCSTLRQKHDINSRLKKLNSYNDRLIH